MIPLDGEDFKPVSSLEYQKQKIDAMSDEEVDKIKAAAEQSIASAGSSKEWLKIGLTVFKEIAGILVLLMLVCIAGCGQRPQPIKDVAALRNNLLQQAIRDKQVRDDAYQSAISAQNLQRVDSDFERNLARTNSVEVDPTTKKALVVYVHPDGAKETEDLATYVQRVIRLRDENRTKIAASTQQERAEDAKVTEKLLAVVQLDALEQRYNQKVAEGTISPDDVSVFVAEMTAAIQPLLTKNKDTK